MYERCLDDKGRHQGTVAHSAEYTKDASFTRRLSSGSLGESAPSPGLEQGGFEIWNWTDVPLWYFTTSVHCIYLCESVSAEEIKYC